jgi:hypothetical protein
MRTSSRPKRRNTWLPVVMTWQVVIAVIAGKPWVARIAWMPFCRDEKRLSLAVFSVVRRVFACSDPLS